MKQIFLFLFFVSIFFSSCSSSQSAVTATAIPRDVKVPTNVPPTSTPLPTMVDTAEIVRILPDEYIDELGIRFHLISPDGEKIALKFPHQEINEQSSTLVSVMTITNEESIDNLEIQLDRTHTYYYFDSWSPDSTAFVGGFYDANLFSGGDWCCGEAIAITNIVNEKAQTSIYSWGWNQANITSWSSDSSMISIAFTNDHGSIIVDRYGKLINRLQQGERTLFWLGNILYYTAKNGERIELRTLNLMTKESEIILDGLGNSYYVAQNEKLGKILLAETIRQENDIYSKAIKFYILDINAKTIKQIQTPNPDITWAYPSVSSPSQAYVALSVSSDWGENNLWLFDWRTYNFKEYGRIKNLFGWYENIDGFLITSLDDKQRIVKPYRK